MARRYMRQIRISNKKHVVASSMPKDAGTEYWKCSAGGAHHWKLNSRTDGTGHIYGKCLKCGSERWDFEGGYPDSEFPKQQPIKLVVDVEEPLDN